MKTIYTNNKNISRNWYIVDADNKTLGRLASAVSHILMGKHKPDYTPYQEIGDYVIIINAEKIHVSGKKMTDKMYYRHSGYLGSLKKRSLQEALAIKPAFPLERAIKGMLPKNRLGRKIFNNVKIYPGSNHPHNAQLPQPLPNGVSV